MNFKIGDIVTFPNCNRPGDIGIIHKVESQKESLKWGGIRAGMRLYWVWAPNRPYTKVRTLLIFTERQLVPL
tara:strand:+ start:2282 stop:2497 length:216 start_codon:yes stop_codon:yes gene_type:complete